MAEYHLDDRQPHACWDNSLEPRLRIQSGDTVVFETLEAAGQITPDWTTADLAHVDSDKVHALTGPVTVEGAEPGDSLAIEILDLKHKGWGWSAVIPGFGLLADEFPDPFLHHVSLEGDTCRFAEGVELPFEPFCGCMGVAPAEPGRLGTIPPRRNGGNIDVRHLTAGSTAYLPVLHAGALFSCGDCHATQGDGEINGTGIESPMTVTLKIHLRKGVKIPELQFRTPAGQPLTRAGGGGYFVTTAHGPNLHENAAQAVRYMLDHLTTEYGLSREVAYVLCGAAVDLKISELVDDPNAIVSAYLPLEIFE
ncbi:MAG: acetamidase/formamidase family protein [Opitutales bacterium]